MKELRKCLAVLMVVLMLVPMIAVAVTGINTNYELSDFPAFDLNGHTDFVIYKEGWRDNRIELALFNSKDKNAHLVMRQNWTLGYEDTNNYLDDEKYYIENDQWKFFEKGYSYATNHCTEVLLSSRDVYDTNGNIVLRGTQFPLESENLTLEQYMTNVILGHNYNGVLKTLLNGSTPQNYLYEYALRPKQISLTRVYVDLLHQNSTFMGNAAAWEVATFSPTDTYENPLDEIGYYEAILMNVLNSAVKYTILPAAVKDVQKNASKLTSSVVKPLKANAEIDYETLLKQPWAMFPESDQLQMIEAAGAKCTSLKKVSGFNSSLSDIFSTAADIREACEKIASLEKIAEVDEYVVNVLNALYANCPSTNTAMQTALSEIKTVCEGSFDKTMVELFNGAATVSNVVVSTGVEALWNDAIAAVGGGIGAGVLIGQLIGTTLSNFLFSTDACLEQFYAMEALTNIETVLVSVVQNFAANYKVFNTSEAAKNFLTAEKMLLGLYDLSADYAKDFTEIVKTKGIINGIQSIFGFGNMQAFEDYCKVVDSMKSSISDFKFALFDFDFGYARALQIDNPTVYTAYLASVAAPSEYWNAKVMTVACPTDVEIYDENGQKVAAVFNNQLFGLVPGVAIWIDGDVKHLILPQAETYSVRVTGTDSGTMDYTVSEFRDGTYVREIAHTDVPLTTGCTYDAILPNKDAVETYDYILTDGDGNTRTPDVDIRNSEIVGADYTEYDKAVEQAKSVDRSKYTDKSLAVLDRALAVDVSGKSITEQSVVDAQTKAILDAINGLEIKTVKKISMHRLYNPNSGEHFYTADVNEKNNLVSVGWKYEGIGWTAPKTSDKPVYRLYNQNGGEHHYTLDVSERDFLVSVGWKYEGIGWYSADTNGIPLYRQYNPNAFANNHNYTADKSENDWLVSLGWKYEGIGWYGVA